MGCVLQPIFNCFPQTDKSRIIYFHINAIHLTLNDIKYAIISKNIKYYRIKLIAEVRQNVDINTGKLFFIGNEGVVN